MAPLDQLVARSLSENRFGMLLFTLFAAVALFLAALGVYGVITLSVAQRTREIGVRMALGAGRGKVAALVLGQGMRLALAGLVAGLAGALATSRFLAGLLYSVQAQDPLTFGVAPLVLVAVAALAAYLPARRASRLDPLTALRQE